MACIFIKRHFHLETSKKLKLTFALNLSRNIHQKNSLQERENVENRKGFLEFREETKIQKDLDGYLDWLRFVIKLL